MCFIVSRTLFTIRHMAWFGYNAFRICYFPTSWETHGRTPPAFNNLRIFTIKHTRLTIKHMASASGEVI